MFKPVAIPPPQRIQQRHGQLVPYLVLTKELLALQYLDDTIIVPVIFVKGKLILHPKTDNQGDSHTDSQPADVDGRGKPIATQIAEGDAEIISEHSCCFWNIAECS